MGHCWQTGEVNRRLQDSRACSWIEGNALYFLLALGLADVVFSETRSKNWPSAWPSGNGPMAAGIAIAARRPATRLITKA